jgi:hypothetical protein
LVVSRFRSSALVALLGLAAFGTGLAQTPAQPTEEKKADASSTSKDEKKPAVNANSNPAQKDLIKNPTAEVIVESSIFVYGFGGGRNTLNQIRKTAFERGKVSLVGEGGKTDLVTYQRWTQRSETPNKEKIRLDQEFANARYALVYNDDKIFMKVGEQIYTPREDVSQAFQNQIVHGLDTMLRYKENESKLELNGKDKILGVEYYIVDITDKQSRKTRFFISAKTFRVMMLDYEQNGVKYRRKFYDYNYAQGTLFPFRTTLWAGDKMIEETEVGTITFGQKVDETLFSGEQG